jgi:hypothetical protein
MFHVKHGRVGRGGTTGWKNETDFRSGNVRIQMHKAWEYPYIISSIIELWPGQRKKLPNLTIPPSNMFLLKYIGLANGDRMDVSLQLNFGDDHPWIPAQFFREGPMPLFEPELFEQEEIIKASLRRHWSFRAFLWCMFSKKQRFFGVSFMGTLIPNPTVPQW